MLDLWLQPVDESSVQWAQSLVRVLDTIETQRWQRYLTAQAKAQFVVAHVATRQVLSYYDDRDPEAWAFAVGAHGRPEIVDGPSGLRFNISHTEGMVAVLVHGPADCGVDVEYTGRLIDVETVSRRVFTQAEQASIFALPQHAQADQFFRLWTLKEAFIKAKGAGLSLPLQQFSFAFEGEQVRFDCDPSVDPAPTEWRFETHRQSSGHTVSIAVHKPPGTARAPVVIRAL